MQRLRRLISGATLWCALAATAQAGGITVFAAASLKEALDEVAAGFTTETGRAVTLSYAGTSALARQIEQGAPADVFISASVDWMDRMQTAGLIRAESRFDLLGNRLVLVGPPQAGPAEEITPATDLARMLDGGRLAMALTEAVPAGIYGRRALESLGLWESVAPSVAETDNVRAALALVALRAAPLGIVYRTDAMAEPRVAVLGLFPDDSYPPIVYPAALTTRAGAEAATFLAHLRSEAAETIFEARGFVVLAD